MYGGHIDTWYPVGFFLNGGNDWGSLWDVVRSPYLREGERGGEGGRKGGMGEKEGWKKGGTEEGGRREGERTGVLCKRGKLKIKLTLIFLPPITTPFICSRAS